MTTKLYKHNVEFLNRISEEFDSGFNKVAFITATGTGKSYVAGAYIQQEINKRGKKVLIITPRIALLDEWKKLLQDFNKVEYMTYQKLPRLTIEELEEISNDYSMIVFDEIHHLGAKIWSFAAKTLFDFADNADHKIKILGLSADAKRYDLDIDIAETMFDSKVIGYSVTEAIEAGILPEFKYTVVTYSLKEDIVQLRRELKGRKRLRATDPVHLLIDQLEEKAANYDIFDIMKQSMPENDNHKFIVFVDKIANIDKEVRKFKKIFPQCKMYKIHSKLSKNLNASQIQEFNDSTNEMCFMFSVGMLNEGVHLDGVTGIIMLRRTESPTLYMQQLGRVLSSGKNHTPVVFDFVSNYSLVGRFRMIYGETSNSARLFNRKKQRDVFQAIYDSSTVEILDIFNSINDLLSYNMWTDEELQILKDNYPTIGTKVSELLPGRSIRECYYKSKILGIKYIPKYERWTDEELQILKDNYPTMGIKVSELLPDKDANDCKNKAFNIGLKYDINDIWTDEEIQILKDNYPTMGSKVSELLSYRSKYSCLHKAYKLGIKKTNSSIIWTDEEIQILKDNYPTMGTKVSKLLTGKNRSQCLTKAFTMGIKQDAIVLTDEEIQILKDNYPTMGSKVSELLPKLTPTQCTSKALWLNIKYIPKSERWTDEEIQILKDNYPTMGRNVSELLPGKTPKECYYKSQILNIKKINNSIRWTDEEIQILKDNYPTMGRNVSELLSRLTPTQCVAKAYKLKLKYNKES